MILRILAIDVETTGLNPNTDMLTEYGAVLYDTEFNNIVAIDNSLVNPYHHEPGNSVPELCFEICGITQPMLNEYGIPPGRAVKNIYTMALKADVFMAHNAKFDRGFLEAAVEKYVMDPKMKEAFKKPWICTKEDVSYPKKCKSKALIYLAADHNFLNPFPHRALADVLTMIKVAEHYDLEALAREAMNPSPRVRVIAHVTREEKQKAKDQGFQWDRDKFIWYKEMKESKLDKAKDNYNFKYSVGVVGV